MSDEKCLENKRELPIFENIFIETGTSSVPFCLGMVVTHHRGFYVVANVKNKMETPK